MIYMIWSIQPTQKAGCTWGSILSHRIVTQKAGWTWGSIPTHRIVWFL